MTEDVELLKAAIAVAVADGELRRSELGVVQGLARRAGVGQASFDAMLEAAKSDATFAQNIVMAPARAHQAIVLLVAQARIDGRVSPQERRVIVRIATCLGIGGDDFRRAFDEGTKKADSIRGSRQKRSEPPGPTPGRSIREEALLILQGRGAILDTAREVSEVLRAHQIEGAIIGGVAVVLHGHVRTTVDVDVYTPQAERLAAALPEKGFAFDQAQRRFVKAGVPVDLVTIDQIGVPPARYED